MGSLGLSIFSHLCLQVRWWRNAALGIVLALCTLHRPRVSRGAPSSLHSSDLCDSLVSPRMLWCCLSRRIRRRRYPRGEQHRLASSQCREGLDLLLTGQVCTSLGRVESSLANLTRFHVELELYNIHSHLVKHWTCPEIMICADSIRTVGTARILYTVWMMIRHLA